MERRSYKRQLFFFILAVLLPSAALVIFGLGFLSQERELTRNRAEQSRTSFARDTGRLLEDRLNEITSEAARQRQTGSDSLRYPAGQGVLWLGTLVGERFTAPWLIRDTAPALNWGSSAVLLQEASRLEFRNGNYAAAAQRYLRLADSAGNARQEAVARQRAARSFVKAGDIPAAIKHALRVLATEFSVVDESGIPVAFYSADLLLATGIDSVRTMVQTRFFETLEGHLWPQPVRTYMLRDLTLMIGDSASIAKVDRLAMDTRYVEEVREDVLAIVRAGVTDRWLQYGDRLVGSSPSGPDGSRELYAITADELPFLAPREGRIQQIQFEGEQTDDAVSLRPYLRDVYVTLSSPEKTFAFFSSGFFALGLVLLLGLTLFGGYLLWRDIQRENRLAQLRAQFVSSVSHELRTPLTSIRMFAETMLLDDDTPLEDRRKYLGVIASESERLTRMLNNVLSISRIEQGTSSYQMNKADLRDPVRAAVIAMQSAFDQEDVPLKSAIPDNPAVADIDSDAVEQAVLNLLSNALKYGGGGPVRLELKTNNSGVDISVTDQGPGIEASEQTRIFDRFYRSENGRQPKVTGTGLGLSLVKHIAEAHGGTVSVHSTIDEGSTFIIHFPTTP